ncbi:PKD domain-containing protein [Thiomicrorhabdus indica]|uniref:PKD domain-containing protein n=1 Tax=Thiomicrorhabdus indica TaxID=2267253 RepID=UPI00102D9AE9|nr:hypothetical protein [Thiomicrorhabdus indica]
MKNRKLLVVLLSLAGVQVGCQSQVSPDEAKLSVSFTENAITETAYQGDTLYLQSNYVGNFQPDFIQVTQVSGESLEPIQTVCEYDSNLDTGVVWEEDKQRVSCTARFEKPYITSTQDYQFQAQAYDIYGNYSESFISVQMLPGELSPLNVTLGQDQLAQNGEKVYLSPVVNLDQRYHEVSYQWQLLSNDFNYDFPTTSESEFLEISVPDYLGTISNGSLVYRLTVVDELGREATDTISVHINQSSNPTVLNVEAGSSIYTHENIIELSGSASEEAIFYYWQAVSEENSNIVSQNSLSTSVELSNDGMYEFELLVSKTQLDTVDQRQSVPEFNRDRLVVVKSSDLIYHVDAGQSLNVNQSVVDLSVNVLAQIESEKLYYYWESLTPDASISMAESASTTALLPNVAGVYQFKVYVSQTPLDAQNLDQVASHQQDVVVVQYAP